MHSTEIEVKYLWSQDESPHKLDELEHFRLWSTLLSMVNHIITAQVQKVKLSLFQYLIHQHIDLWWKDVSPSEGKISDHFVTFDELQ